jgi:hypothetical protein
MSGQPCSTRSFDEEGFREGLSRLSEATEMTTGIVSNGAHISRARRYQLRHKQAGLFMVCAMPVVSKNYCAKHAVAAREQQRAWMKFKQSGAASYSFFNDKQLIAKAITTVFGWLDVSPALPASGDRTSEPATSQKPISTRPRPAMVN